MDREWYRPVELDRDGSSLLLDLKERASLAKEVLVVGRREIQRKRFLDNRWLLSKFQTRDLLKDERKDKDIFDF